MFTRLLAKSPAKRVGEQLYQEAARQARTPALYLHMGAPDTVEGRFELLTLHVILLVERLRVNDAEASAVRQCLFDAYVSNLDGALREMGVGDLAVGKRMRKLGEAFYGRAQAYDEAFAELPDPTALKDLLSRTVLRDLEATDAMPLSIYVEACRERLHACDLVEILNAAPRWANP